MTEPTELLHGTLDALILKTLAWGPRHGYAIAHWIGSSSADALRIEQGSLYPALYRLERKGLIEAEWGLSETRRQVKLYRLTRAGRQRLKVEMAQWKRFADAVSGILLEPAT
jgi:transcriptional regulator